MNIYLDHENCLHVYILFYAFYFKRYNESLNIIHVLWFSYIPKLQQN